MLSGRRDDSAYERYMHTNSSQWHAICHIPYPIFHGSNLAINFGFIPLLLLLLQQKKVGLANPKIYDKWPEHISTPKDRSCKTNVQLFLKFDSCRHVKASLRGNVQFSIKLWV